MVIKHNAGRPEQPADPAHAQARKGRGALSQRNSRFEDFIRESDPADLPVSDAYLELTPTQVPTTLTRERATSIITRNDSPDIPFTQSINPYRGCEHGCIYCYARPSHAYLGLSPGLEFETRLFAKDNAVSLFRQALSKPRYRPEPIALGANTDPYQPAEKRLRLTRGLLEVALEFGQPMIVVTKSALVERDIDLLAALAEHQLVQVFVSVTTLDNDIARKLEPRATAPGRRLQALNELASRGVPTGVIVAPIIPVLTDVDLERILCTAAETGATQAGYVVLRLPLEVRQLFEEWLQFHYPERAEHIMSLIRQLRGGKTNDSTYGRRMRGTGAFADLIRQRFALACRRYHLNESRPILNTTGFSPPAQAGSQLDLFDD